MRLAELTRPDSGPGSSRRLRNELRQRRRRGRSGAWRREGIPVFQRATFEYPARMRVNCDGKQEER